MITIPTIPEAERFRCTIGAFTLPVTFALEVRLPPHLLATTDQAALRRVTNEIEHRFRDFTDSLRPLLAKPPQ